MSDKKYELTDDTKEVDGVTVRRIRALRDVGSTNIAVRAGQVGGYVEGEHNLSHLGSCWVHDNAIAMNRSIVTHNALMRDSAMATHYARVTHDACVSGHSVVRDNAVVGGEVRLYGSAQIRDTARVSGTVMVDDEVIITGHSHLYGNAHAMGDAYICDVTMGIGTVDADAHMESSQHVITLTGVTDEPVTVFRTKQSDGTFGHRVVAGCQMFRLDETLSDIQDLADRNDWTLSAGWEPLRDALLALVRNWEVPTPS
jgi:hypothetical protein